jgi:hypothetical protein
MRLICSLGSLIRGHRETSKKPERGKGEEWVVKGGGGYKKPTRN